MTQCKPIVHTMAATMKWKLLCKQAHRNSNTKPSLQLQQKLRRHFEHAVTVAATAGCWQAGKLVSLPLATECLPLAAGFCLLLAAG